MFGVSNKPAATSSATSLNSIEYLSESFRLLDEFLTSNKSSGSSSTQQPDAKRNRTEVNRGANSSTSRLESLEKGLEMLIQAMEKLGSHLLPSCDAMGRRISRLLPNRIDPTIHTPLIWTAVQTYCATFGASSAKLLADVLTEAMERRPSSSAPPAANTDDAATTTTTPQERDAIAIAAASMPLLEYFGNTATLRVMADALLCCGPYIHSTLLQGFAQRVSTGLVQPLVLHTEAGSLTTVSFANQLETHVTPVAALASCVALVRAIVLVCRPLPAVVLTVAQRLCNVTLRQGAAGHLTSDTRRAVAELQLTCRLVTMPEALPWYIPPADVVAPPPSVPTPAPVSVPAPAPVSHYSAAHHASTAAAVPIIAATRNSSRGASPIHKPVSSPKPTSVLHAALTKPHSPIVAAASSSSKRDSSQEVAKRSSQHTRGSPAAAVKRRLDIDDDTMPDIILD